MNVVLVDDDQSLCYSIKDVLDHGDDFKVTGLAFNGEDAIKLIEKSPPDIVVLDIIMPKGDGLDVLKHFKGKYKTEFLVLSALGHEKVTRRAIELGAMFYLMKPFNSKEFLDKMRSLFIGENIRNIKSPITSSLCYKAIEESLNALGVPRHVKGYRYLYHGIYEIYKMNNMPFKITKDIYPKLADQFKTTPSSVEKAIRSTVDMTLTRGNRNFLNAYFSNELFNDKITNKAFMLKIANKIENSL